MRKRKKKKNLQYIYFIAVSVFISINKVKTMAKCTLRKDNYKNKGNFCYKNVLNFQIFVSICVCLHCCSLLRCDYSLDIDIVIVYVYNA